MTRVAALLSPNPGGRGGGVERFCSLLSDVLAARDFEPQVVGPTGDPSRWVYRLGAGALSRSRSAGEAAAAVAPAFVVGNGFLGVGAPHVPRVQVFHGTTVGYARRAVGVRQRERLRWLFGDGLAEALAARGATAVVAVSERAAAEVRRSYRARVDAVVPNGVDTEVFAPRDRGQARERLGLPEGQPIALYVGRVEARKGPAELTGACAAAGWTLAVAGATAPPGARHLGLLEPDELAWAYAACDAVLFPSRYEGCSYVVLEALACGVPIFTTAVGWIPTLLQSVPAYSKLLAPVGDAQAFAALLRAGVSDAQASAVAEACAFVRQHNSLQAWSSAWNAVLDRWAPV
jgi:glycosyltransferase involved in cell wall biosynthesis